MISNTNPAFLHHFFSHRFPLLFIISLLVSGLLAPSLFAGTQTVFVGVYENAPKIFTVNGQPKGLYIDVIEYIAKSEGWELRYVPGTWGEGLDRLEKGAIDLMPDVAYSAERGKSYSFHEVPVFSSWFQVYAPKGNTIQTILDLNGKRILILERSIQQEAFVRLSKGFGLQCTLIAVPDYKIMFEMVAKGQADVAVTNRFYGMMHAKQYGLEDTAILFEPSDLYYAVTKNDTKGLLRAIDRHLTELKEHPDSLYYASLRKWTSKKIVFKLPFWLKITASVVVGVLAVSLVGSALLKRQVTLRTRELQLINQEMEQRILERTAELAAVNEEQLTIFESAGVGIVMLRDRVIVRCNRKMEKISGYAAAELVGQSTRLWYADENAFHTGGKEIYAQMAKGETVCIAQPMARKDGSQFWARVSLRAFDQNNPLKGAVGIVEDITNEREAAETLRKAMEKAQEADRIKSAFLATMSHELRTPLNSIIGFTGIMLQGLAGPLNEEQHKQMAMVQKSSRHLLSLINDVLDLSKIEAGQLSLSPEPFALKASLEKVAQLVAPLAEHKGLRLRVDISEEVGILYADQRRFEQVILNLINNSIKFTEKGRITLVCHLDVDNDQYLISITDTGIGMREEELAGLFQPFHQIDSGLARKHEGTGLGLSISQKLLDLMGGFVEVQSQWGQGSRFTVHLPRQTGGAV